MSGRLRIDAARNYVEIVAAARRVVARWGPDVALERVAAEAGVGIATLYRHFPDRGSLLTAVVVSALEKSERAARAAAGAQHGDGLDAVGRYLDTMLHSQAAAVVPALVARDDVDHRAVDVVRDRSARAVEELVERAHADGSLARSITAGDIGVMLVRLSRPLPGDLPAGFERDLQRRHVAITLAGLRHCTEVDDAGPTFAELSAVGARRAGPASR